MWYAIQIVVAGSVAYAWTTLPENSPKDFGHGLFLGGIVAWFVTATICATRDLFNRRKANDQSLLRGVDSRAHKQPQKKVGFSRRMRSRPPKLVSKVGLRRSVGYRRPRNP